MELLTRRRFTPKAALDGSPVGTWHGFPVEEAVTNGLLLVVLDYARKEDRAVATSDDVVAIARRVDSLVNAGFSVGYPNVESAAEAFVKKVVEPVHRAALAGFRPDDPPPMATWKEIVAGKPVPGPIPRATRAGGGIGEIGTFLGRPAALFFVRVINAALRHRARLETRLADLVRFNLAGGQLTWIPDSDLDFARRAIRALAGDPAQPVSRKWGSWLESGAAFDGCRERIAQLRRWPVRLKTIPSGMQRASVQEGWLETIVLMAIGRLKNESDTLTPSGFWKAISLYGETCRGGKGTGPLRARILKSLKAREGTLSPETVGSITAALDPALEKVDAAFHDYERMVSEMTSVEREMAGWTILVRKCDARLAKAKKGKEAIRDEREIAAERLARLQELHDLAKNEFRANHFPAIFLPETAPEEALMGG